MVGSCANEWPAFLTTLLKGMGMPDFVSRTISSTLFHKKTGAFAPLPLLRRAVGFQRKERNGFSDNELTELHKELAASLHLAASSLDLDRGRFDRWLAMHAGDPVPRMAQLLLSAPQDMLAALQSKHGMVFTYRLELSESQSPSVSPDLLAACFLSCLDP